jgi:hypothetical protein
MQTSLQSFNSNGVYYTRNIGYLGNEENKLLIPNLEDAEEYYNFSTSGSSTKSFQNHNDPGVYSPNPDDGTTLERWGQYSGVMDDTSRNYTDSSRGERASLDDDPSSR